MYNIFTHFCDHCTYILQLYLFQFIRLKIMLVTFHYPCYISVYRDVFSFIYFHSSVKCRGFTVFENITTTFKKREIASASTRTKVVRMPPAGMQTQRQLLQMSNKSSYRGRPYLSRNVDNWNQLQQFAKLTLGPDWEKCA